MRLIISLVLVAVVCGAASAQIVFDKPKPEKVQTGPATGDTAAPARQEKPGKRSMEAWVRTLASGLGDGNPAIRRSAAVALSNVGAPAVPVLQNMSQGEGRAAAEAKRVLEQIKRRGRRGSDAVGGNRRTDQRPAAQRLNATLKKAGFEDAQLQTVARFQKSRQERMREIFRQVQDGEMTREEAAAARQRVTRELNAELKTELGKDAYRKFIRANRAVNGRNGDRPNRRRNDRNKKKSANGEGSGGN